jgi:hypothetical protein
MFRNIRNDIAYIPTIPGPFLYTPPWADL